jgi:hypothetical protein
VMLQQPEGGSALHAGGTRPAGLWSGAVSFKVIESVAEVVCWRDACPVWL